MAQNDFDFFHGKWSVHNRRLTEDGWIEFPADCSVRGLVGGIGFVDEMTFPTLGSGGSTIGLYDSNRGLWAHYWVSTRDGVLQPPVFGTSAGEFYGDDEVDGKPVKVRYLWDVHSNDAFRWEQAFSSDGELTWETNWVMEFSRIV
ncbi:MAG TPA: hypothetical protein DGG94_10170 [Micromonosporaceae bacterium]|nr:hypothetical protein [Micromonosporaceae bacterium]HCU50148.1 hypothetical protein [Micromonosporaceae bacterium]